MSYFSAFSLIFSDGRELYVDVTSMKLLLPLVLISIHVPPQVARLLPETVCADKIAATFSNVTLIENSAEIILTCYITYIVIVCNVLVT
jgi:hypothetical protein